MKTHPPALAMSAGLLLAALALMPTAGRIRNSDIAPVQAEPPPRVGEWTAERVRYCHQAGCRKEWRGASAAGEICPACRGPLHSLSFLEFSLLPRDTSLHKAVYVATNRPSFVTSIVISSRERSSIHRPEVCLVGQGSELVHAFVHESPRAEGPPLRVTVLELVRRVPRADGEATEVPTYFAYWFAGPRRRETPSHYTRMAWMAYDRVVRGEASRWAYIAVGGSRSAQDRAYLGELDRFLRELAPSLAP